MLTGWFVAIDWGPELSATSFPLPVVSCVELFSWLESPVLVRLEVVAILLLSKSSESTLRFLSDDMPEVSAVVGSLRSVNLPELRVASVGGNKYQEAPERCVLTIDRGEHFGKNSRPLNVVERNVRR